MPSKINKSMQTITIDIINEKALNLLKDLELLKLIRLHKDDEKETKMNWSDYKGSMTKQPLNIVEEQLKELRKEWE